MDISIDETVRQRNRKEEKERETERRTYLTREKKTNKLKKEKH